MTGASLAASSSITLAEGETVRVNPLVRWSLYVTAFLIPLEYPDRFPFEVSTIAGSAFLLATALHPGPCYRRLPWAMGAYALYILVQLVALITQGTGYSGGFFPDLVTKSLLLLLLWVLFFWACSNLFRQEGIYRAAFRSLVLGCLIRAALPLSGLARTAHVQGTGGERVTALGQNANQSAQVLALGLVALIGLAYVQPRSVVRPRFLVWGAVGLIALAMVQTGSRGGLMTFAVGLLVYLTTGRSIRARLRNAVVVLVGLGGLFFLVSHSEVMRGRIERAQEGSASQREHIFPLLFDMFQEKPLLGWGPITNKYELARRLGDPTHGRRDAHNLILEILTASGLLGAIPFLSGVWLSVRSAWTARAGPRGIVPLAMILALIAGNMTENRIAGPLLWLVLASALASGGAGEARPARPLL